MCPALAGRPIWVGRPRTGCGPPTTGSRRRGTRRSKTDGRAGGAYARHELGALVAAIVSLLDLVSCNQFVSRLFWFCNTNAENGDGRSNWQTGDDKESG